MPTYQFTSPRTGRTYGVQSAAELPDDDIDALVNDLDFEAAREAGVQPGVDPAVLQQGPVGTFFGSFPNTFSKIGSETIGGVGRMLDKASESLSQATGLPKGGDMFQRMADYGDELSSSADITFPQNPLNPVAGALGSGAAQGLSLLAGGLAGKALTGSNVAMTAVPAASGFLSGANQGIQTAEEIGVQSPLAQLGTGMAFGGLEVLTERLGGIGSKAGTEALTRAVRQTAGQMLRSSGRAVGSEALEEVLAGRSQAALTRLIASEDPNNPGFTRTGVNLDALASEIVNLEAMKLEALGGAAGGTVFAGVQALANRQLPNDPTTSPNQPPAPGQPGAPAPMGAGAPGAAAVSPLIGIAQRGGAVDVTLPDDTGELTAEEVADLEMTNEEGRMTNAVRQPILQGVPDQVPQATPALPPTPTLPPSQSQGVEGGVRGGEGFPDTLPPVANPDPAQQAGAGASDPSEYTADGAEIPFPKLQAKYIAANNRISVAEVQKLAYLKRNGLTDEDAITQTMAEGLANEAGLEAAGKVNGGMAEKEAAFNDAYNAVLRKAGAMAEAPPERPIPGMSREDFNRGMAAKVKQATTEQGVLPPANYPAASQEPAPTTETRGISLLRQLNAELPPAAQARWTPEVYAKSERYMQTGNEADLEGLTPIQRKRVINARIDADPDLRKAQEQWDRKMEHKASSIEKRDRAFEQKTTFKPKASEQSRDDAPGFQHLVIDRDLEAGFMSGAGADALIDLAHRAFAAGRTFAQWAATMVQRFGAAVRDYLAGVWDHAKRSSQTGALNFTSRLGNQLQQASQQAARPAATAAPLKAAYASALRGSSTAMIPLADVFAAAQAANPALSQEQFQAQVMTDYEAGSLMLEGAGSPQEAQNAGLRIDGTPVGTAVRMMVPQAALPLRNLNNKNPASVSQGGAFRDVTISKQVSIRSPKADAVLPAVESFDSFQSAPERPTTGEDYNTYLSAQGKKFQQRLNLARDQLSTARQAVIDAERDLRGLNLGMMGMPQGFARDWITQRAAGALDGYRNPYVARSIIDTELLPLLEARNAAAREALIAAEVELYLAEEAEGGTADRLNAKQSAGERQRTQNAATFAALLDARDDQAKHASKSFLTRVWQSFAQNDEAFQFGKTTSTDADSIALAVSLPGRQITARQTSDSIRFMGANGYLDILDADTSSPYIRSSEASSKGKKGGGGTQLYQAALDWIHNNGKRVKDDPGGLTSINAIRRSSNFFSSALRWGTTKHLKPHSNQAVKWSKSDTRNIAALATREMELAFKAIAQARNWRYDFNRGIFINNAGQQIADQDLENAVIGANPAESGIGVSTLERAIITASAIEAFQRGEAESVVSEIGDRDSLPDRLTGILYSPSELAANQSANEAILRNLGLPTTKGSRTWGGKKIQGALQKLAQDERYPATTRRMAQELAARPLDNLLLKIEADARLNWAGLYQPFNNGRGELSLNTRTMGRGELDIGISLVHEVLHHATYQALRNPKTAAQKQAAKDLQALYTRAKAALAANEQLSQFDYELSNVDEFITGLWTRADFQTALAGIPADAAPTLGQRVRSLLDEIFRVLSELVTGKAVPPGSVLEASMAATLRIMEDGRTEVEFGANAGDPLQNPASRLAARVLPLHQRGEPFRVKQLGARAILTGSPLPADVTQVLAMTENERQAVAQSAAQVGNDLQAAVKAYLDRTGQDERVTWDKINAVMEGQPGALTLLTAIDPALGERSRRARNMLDDLSAAVAQTLPTGILRDAIKKNQGSWMRRGYAAFDPESGWNFDGLTKAAKAGRQIGGKDAAKILAAARAYLRSQNPQNGRTLKEWNADIEADMRDLMDRTAWQSANLGGNTLRKNVSSFMRRKDIAPEIRALMGEETNPLHRFVKSAAFQAQIVARHHGQVAVRALGLQTGLFSTQRGGVYTEEIEPSENRWSGLAGVWTTPEMKAALANSSAVNREGTDLGGWLVGTVKALGNEAKLNRVALNLDSWVVNILGNVVGLVQSGDVFAWDFARRLTDARALIKSGKARPGSMQTAAQSALIDAQRAMLARLRGMGVIGSSITLADIEASIPRHLLQWVAEDRARNTGLGAVKGAIMGQAAGRGLGLPGRVVGGVAGGIGGAIAGAQRLQNWQQNVADYVMTGPDALARVTGWLTNYETALAAGLAGPTFPGGLDQAAAWATTRTLNTFPNYNALPALLRQLSRLGFTGSFIAFQWEVYRNFGWNVKYAIEELSSGNAAIQARGMRRLAGIGSVAALAGGGLAALLGAAGAAASDDEERNKIWRQWFAAPWEKDAVLAFDKYDKEGVSYYNTSYLLPQMTMMELIQGASEGRDPADSASRVVNRLSEQFIAGSVHLQPLLAAFANQDRFGRRITNAKGLEGAAERADEAAQVILEPGFADKITRLTYALRGAEKNGRKFSVEEEMKRLAGIRQVSRTWEELVKRRYSQFTYDYQGVRDDANKILGENLPGAPVRAVKMVNDKVIELQQQMADYERDLRRLGVPEPTIKAAKKDSSLQRLNSVRVRADGRRVEAVTVR